MTVKVLDVAPNQSNAVKMVAVVLQVIRAHNFGSFYCVLGTDGRIGCCPNGKTCYGPIGGGNNGGDGCGCGGDGGDNGGNNGDSGGGGGGGGGGGSTSLTSSSATLTSSSRISTSPSTSNPFTANPFTASLTQTTPTPSPGFTNVVIGVNSLQITWTSGWTIQPSTCGGGQKSKITTTIGQSFTFITPQNSGPYLYIDLSVQAASFAVYINGAQANVNLTQLMNNCTYHQLGPIVSTTSTNNVTVYVYGPLMSGRQAGNTGVPWSFGFNSFMYVFLSFVVRACCAQYPCQYRTEVERVCDSVDDESKCRQRSWDRNGYPIFRNSPLIGCHIAVGREGIANWRHCYVVQVSSLWLTLENDSNECMCTLRY
ncbi:hypothetical protein AX15_001688 [Amanita polypyramis BW_CC]|nr:hypothetical protein AX15_001688 [Amanita polypyramis BW_CC]